nr:ATP-binding cassette domain-containing protein [Vibrio sp. S9_S30]
MKKSFGDVDVLKDINLTVKDKEFVCFLGPSGCGKSTLLRSIAGLEEITEGELFINGNEMSLVPAAKRDLAMVFQSYALYPHMSVYKNMSFGLKLQGKSKQQIDELVHNAADILQLTPLLKRKPKALSGGQRQRVAIGRAIVRNPKIFLLDEPLSNLDAALRVSMRTELAKLHHDLEATMIYVTHDQIEAMTLADRVVVLHDGYVAQFATPLELYHRPANLFVAGFIGSPKMNFLPAELVAIQGNSVTISSPMFNRDVTIELESANELELTGDLNATSELNALVSYPIGSQFTLGIRPHEFTIDRNTTYSICSMVTVVERLGAESIIYSESVLNDKTITLICSSNGTQPIKFGTSIELGFESSSCLLFDESGKALPRKLTEDTSQLMAL